MRKNKKEGDAHQRVSGREIVCEGGTVEKPVLGKNPTPQWTNEKELGSWERPHGGTPEREGS